MTARFSGAFAALSVVLLGGCRSDPVEITGLVVKPTLEDRKEDGSLFTPETQSILRGSHLLENVKGLDIQVRDDDRASVILKCGEAGEVTYDNIPLDQLVPRLHYAPASPPDEFDVAHAIGSLLDGLAWLHEHGFTHGAVDELALTSGPTGGRLSLAGALSRRGNATVADDVFGAAVLAYGLLVGEPPGLDANDDPRLHFSAQPEDSTRYLLASKRHVEI